MSDTSGVTATKLIDKLCDGKTIRANNRHIETLIQKLNQKIKKALSPYEDALERLREIPGLSRKTVEGLIAEIGLDIEVFPTEQHLCSWVDVSPGNNESAGKKADETSSPKPH